MFCSVRVLLSTRSDLTTVRNENEKRMIARQYVGAVQRVPKLTPEPPYVDVEFAPLFSFDMTYLNLRV